MVPIIIITNQIENHTSYLDNDIGGLTERSSPGDEAQPNMGKPVG